MKLKITIPEGWDEITLKAYQRYMLTQNTDNSNSVKIVQMISAFCRISTEEASKINLKDLALVTNKLNKILSVDVTNFTQIFELNKVKYGFIPNWEEITIGEYVDLEELIKLGFWENVHKIMAIFYRPVIAQKDNNEYIIEDYTPNEGRAKDFLGLSMDLVLGCTSFFLLLGVELQGVLSSSLTQKKNPKTKKTEGN
tara:strand:- start:5619 stop:6209 length:591 start_codon:yes stop_codon:yes gene_type:complete